MSPRKLPKASTIVLNNIVLKKFITGIGRMPPISAGQVTLVPGKLRHRRNVTNFGSISISGLSTPSIVANSVFPRFLVRSPDVSACRMTFRPAY